MMKVAIIGSGPAGLFCADKLAGHADVTIYETGLPIDKRVCPETGCDKCKICHVLEGEGGAGGLSDGKNTYSLTRGTQMDRVFQKKEGQLLIEIDKAMVRFAGWGVWYNALSKPPTAFEGSPLKFESYPLRHVGSDGIRKFIRGFISHLRESGVKVLTNQFVYPVFITSSKRKAKVVGIASDGTLCTYDKVVIAAGLQGIPWIERMMKDVGSPLGDGPAGFGIRLETDASILADLHRQFYDYKMIYEHSSGITIRSFCCNQNGYVLNERHTDLGIINVNGHSFLDPSMHTKSSNMAIMAKISEPTVYFPQLYVCKVARQINECAKGSAYQSILDFMGDEAEIRGSYRTNKQSKPECISGLLPGILLEAFRSFIRELNAIVPIISPKSIIYAPEIKYYGRRVNVTKEWKSKDVKNLYIVGSGSGYLDSFVAAALSGIVAAENIKKEVL